MLSKFIFILVLLSNEGDISMRAFDVDECPDKIVFSEEMEKLRKAGDFITWEAACIERTAKQERVSND